MAEMLFNDLTVWGRRADIGLNRRSFPGGHRHDRRLHSASPAWGSAAAHAPKCACPHPSIEATPPPLPAPSALSRSVTQDASPFHAVQSPGMLRVETLPGAGRWSTPLGWR